MNDEASLMKPFRDAAFRFKRGVLGPLRVRRSHVFCLGTAKSGTHSICSMFSRNVRAKHEPQAEALIDRFFDWREGRIGAPEMASWLHARDREMALEVDSSWLNIVVLDFLVREFPEARFILTLRDCYSWLNSEFNRVLRFTSVSAQRVKLRKFLYDPENLPHAPQEQILKEKGIYPVDAYLARWAAHNEEFLAKVPVSRQIMIRTGEIGRCAQAVADFAGLPRYAVRLHRTHEFKNPVKQEIIRELDRNFLEQKIEKHCRPLMTRFFPEIQSLDDAKL
jgi:hypothetical protein